jgi:hypothetical protein
MILFNITILSDNEVHEELRSWILKDFIPTVAKEELFRSQSLLKILNSPNEGVTYSLQFIAENEDKVDTFRKGQLLSLHNKAQNEYANQVYLLESLMEFQ